MGARPLNVSAETSSCGPGTHGPGGGRPEQAGDVSAETRPTLHRTHPHPCSPPSPHMHWAPMVLDVSVGTSCEARASVRLRVLVMIVVV